MKLLEHCSGVGLVDWFTEDLSLALSNRIGSDDNGACRELLFGELSSDVLRLRECQFVNELGGTLTVAGSSFGPVGWGDHGECVTRLGHQLSPAWRTACQDKRWCG